jgi:hypothetical protein
MEIYGSLSTIDTLYFLSIIKDRTY